MKQTRFTSAALVALLLTFTIPLYAQEPRRITILYDAFGPPSRLVKDWGFAALVEYGGKRVLFDTGNDAKIFESNVRQLGVDLTRLDAVVISHRHGDHTSGLTYLLEVNPGVTIYTPHEGAFFKSQAPAGFLEPQPGLPPDLRYYDGKPPERWVSGTPWEKGRFEIVTATTEILPGFYVLTPRSTATLRSNGSPQDIAPAKRGSPCFWIASRSGSTAPDSALSWHFLDVDWIARRTIE